MKMITKIDLENILTEWASGKVDATHVHSWAENRYAVDEYETESGSANEVLARLDMMDMNLTTVDDIPVLILALKSENFLSILDNHTNEISIEERKIELRNIPLYKKYCV
jgi:hypothetical protein